MFPYSRENKQKNNFTGIANFFKFCVLRREHIACGRLYATINLDMKTMQNLKFDSVFMSVSLAHFMCIH